MKNESPFVYGIGNPLIDVIVSVSEQELKDLGLYKGTMNLVNVEKRLELSSFIKENKTPSYSCGGSCPNTIITLSAMGIKTALGGKVGKDEYGDIYRKNLKALNVLDNLGSSENPTGSSIILITPDSDRTMNTFLGANRDFCFSDINEETLKKADFFHFTGYMLDTKNQTEAIYRAIEIAKSSGAKISFDIADQFAVGRNRDAFLEIIKSSCDIVFANKQEARIMFDNYDAELCCKSMGKLCETAIVKNGKKGSFISYRGEIYNIPVKGPSVPVDTTGAGDTYAAGFLYGLCNGMDVVDSGTIASVLAGQIIKQVGAQFSKEKAEELRELLVSGKWKDVV